MSRRFPRIRIRFAATVQLVGQEDTLICRTRDISMDGCFLETAERLAPGAEMSLAVFDNETGEVVCVESRVVRAVTGPDDGVGVAIVDPPTAWRLMVERFRAEPRANPAAERYRILVVSDEYKRRSALSLYVTTGWDVRFAVDVATALEALGDVRLDAVVAEFEARDPAWESVMRAAAARQPGARRFVRCRTTGVRLPMSGPNELVHRFVESDSDSDALMDAVTAEMSAGLLRTQNGFEMQPGESGARALLRKVLNSIDTVKKGEAIVAFDLDSTLLDNAPRQSVILREYGRDVGVRELELSKPEHWTTWDVGEAMSKTGLDAVRVEQHRRSFKDYWRQRFFTSEYCVLDEAVLGAAAFVRAVGARGARVYYVTGRHEGMRDGTLQCLERLGFPLPDATTNTVELLMKPTLEEDDDTYKEQTHQHLKAVGAVVGIFDNEPMHINAYKRAFPNALAVHLATNDSGRDVHLLPGIPSIPDFSL